MDLPDFSRASAVRLFDPLTPTVFHEAWWLDVVTDRAWADVSVESGGRTVGRLPYVLAKMPLRQTLCYMPELTHFLGPAIDTGRGSAANRSLRQASILRDLLAKLPRTTGFYQKLHRFTPDTLGFQDHGFRTSVQFTYEIAPGPVADIWRGMRDKTRNVIRRAADQFEVVDYPDPPHFTEIYTANLESRGVPNQYRRIAPLADAALTRCRGRIIAARDAAGAMPALVFYVWDAHTAYYFLTTRSAAAGNNAVSLLLWHAIQDAVARNLVFDFDGVANPGSRLFYTGFGGTVSPRYIVSRFTKLHRVAGRLANPFPKRESWTYLT